ncbi:MAG: hypothetical protein OEW91_01630, partial [Acidimicrobiia bacterium]|nr:hypothetical protein [Acidimicrobiia bacterium]
VLAGNEWRSGRRACIFGGLFLNSSRQMNVLLNLLWFVLGGWIVFLGYLFGAILLCLTIIGIPFGVACWKMVPLALLPLGREVVPLRGGHADPYGLPN